MNRRTGVTEGANEGYGLKTLSRLSCISRFIINALTIKAADNLFPSRRSFFYSLAKDFKERHILEVLLGACRVAPLLATTCQAG